MSRSFWDKPIVLLIITLASKKTFMDSGLKTRLRIFIYLAFLFIPAGNCSDAVSFYSDEIEPCGVNEEKDIEECLDPMLSYANELQNKGLLPVEGAKVFDELCALYKTFLECTSVMYCRSMSISAMQASYGYMCGQGYPLFYKNVDCFAQVESDDVYKVCKDSATSGVHELQLDKTPPAKYLGHLCRVMTEYLRCSQPIIHTTCGTEAWDIVKKVTMESLQVTMPECDLSTVL